MAGKGFSGTDQGYHLPKLSPAIPSKGVRFAPAATHHTLPIIDPKRTTSASSLLSPIPPIGTEFMASQDQTAPYLLQRNKSEPDVRALDKPLKLPKVQDKRMVEEEFPEEVPAPIREARRRQSMAMLGSPWELSGKKDKKPPEPRLQQKRRSTIFGSLGALQLRRLSGIAKAGEGEDAYLRSLVSDQSESKKAVAEVQDIRVLPTAEVKSRSTQLGMEAKDDSVKYLPHLDEVKDAAEINDIIDATLFGIE